jgi:NhaP-type Na+/H+ or K+/H+ antiporter
VDRYRFQFEIIASYLTGFLISGIGFGAIVAANSRAAASGASGRTAVAVAVVAEKLVAEECDRNAAVAATSNATTTNAEFNSRFMEDLH